jgi:hypothetical protein
MAWQIQITRAKPNPAGKDSSHGRPIPQQLLAEWVDLKNIGDAAVRLSSLHLANTQFGPACQIHKQAQIYWNDKSSTVLQPGETVRVHTGREVEAWRMNQEDRLGVNHHSFADSGNFVLNNDCGDNLSVWWQGQDEKWHRDDAASYDPYPPEGQVLQRSGSKLVPSYVFAAR